jgi:hypothetical protein
MAKDPVKDQVLPTRKQALKVAKMLGCTGAHKKEGGWGLCESDEALDLLIKKGSAAYREWQAEQGKKSACCEECKEKAPHASDKKNFFGTRAEAEAAAAAIGCAGAHQMGVGKWMPCDDHEQYVAARNSPNVRRLVIETPNMKRRKRIIDLPRTRNNNWEPLINRGVRGVEALPGGGLVSGKRDYTDERRAEYAGRGMAMPDGSYPIRDVGDLKNAIQAFGRAKSKPAVKRHIKKRARALGATELIPEHWKVS